MSGSFPNSTNIISTYLPVVYENSTTIEAFVNHSQIAENFTADSAPIDGGECRFIEVSNVPAALKFVLVELTKSIFM